MPQVGQKPRRLHEKGTSVFDVTARALKPCKSSGPHAAIEEAEERVLKERRESIGISASGCRAKGLHV